MKKIVLVLVAGSLLVFNSCTKTGPQGPQGPAGPQGQAGATGPAGPQGNANVVGNGKSFSVPASTWAFNSTANYYSVDFSDPDITTDVVNGGIVEMFRYYSSSDSWSNLPDINGNQVIVFNFYLGGFSIFIQTTDGSAPVAPTSAIIFRDVVITPSQRQAHPNTNWKNYSEATSALNNVQAPPAH